MPFSREDVIYAAGLYEGEGSIGTYDVGKGMKYRQTRITINMTDPEPLARFVNAFGFGRITGPYRLDNPRHKPYWAMVINGSSKTQAAIAAMWPWLSNNRRNQAKRAFRG